MTAQRPTHGSPVMTGLQSPHTIWAWPINLEPHQGSDCTFYFDWQSAPPYPGAPHHTLQPPPEEWKITGIHTTAWWVTRDFQILDENHTISWAVFETKNETTCHSSVEVPGRVCVKQENQTIINLLASLRQCPRESMSYVQQSQ